jgi:hypothetical protein
MPVAQILVQILITGIVAVVPSKNDDNLTRIVVPNGATANERHRHIPEHYAFLDIPAENYVPVTGERLPSFRYPNSHDGFNEHVVFLLGGEVVDFEKKPDNSDNHTVDKTPLPACLTKPNEKEKTSIFYALDMSRVCTKCKVAKDLFDIKNTDKVAARMDLYGGHEHVGDTKFEMVWDLARSSPHLKQPLTSEIVFDYYVSLDSDKNERERLKITRPGFVDRVSYITLQASPRQPGSPIPVTIGNSPLSGIMYLKEGAHVAQGVHHDEHFALIYDAFDHKPWFHHPNPKLVSGVLAGVVNVLHGRPFSDPNALSRATDDLHVSSLINVFRAGGNPLTDDCIPIRMGKQDP